MIPVNRLDQQNQKLLFFLIIPPGFEGYALDEIRFKGLLPNDLPSLNAIRGGIEFSATYDQAQHLAQSSRLATRVLQRVEKFRCRDFPKLFKKVEKLELWRFLAEDMQVFVSARQSRLMNKKRIESTVRNAIFKKKQNLVGSFKELYVRFENDEVELSLNISERFLFKRGYKVLEAEAPIRENLAAGLFWALYGEAGRPQNFELIDFTCGTGTFLTEAGTFFTNTASQPSFALYGFDSNPQVIEVAKKNIDQAGLAGSAQFALSDFLKQEKSFLGPKPGGVDRIGISNPPYGVRLKWPVPAREFYSQLLSAYSKSDVDCFGIVVPKEKVSLLPTAAAQIAFKNGGLDVVFQIYKSDRLKRGII